MSRPPPGGPTVDERCKKFVDYIRNTGKVPLPIEEFDDDWFPIGAFARMDLERQGLILETVDGITLTEAASK